MLLTLSNMPLLQSISVALAQAWPLSPPLSVFSFLMTRSRHVSRSRHRSPAPGRACLVPGPGRRRRRSTSRTRTPDPDDMAGLSAELYGRDHGVAAPRTPAGTRPQGDGRRSRTPARDGAETLAVADPFQIL